MARKAKSDHADVIVVLDRTGSMDSVRQATIDGYNKFIDEQKAVPGTCNVTLVQFDLDLRDPICQIAYEGRPIADVPHLTLETYEPRGSTPLFDAVGETVTREKAKVHAGKVICVIITDGENNASKEWTSAQLQALVNEQRKAGWEFVFMGADIDAYKAGASMAMPAANTYAFASSQKGTAGAYHGLSQTMASFRSGATPTMDMSGAPVWDASAFTKQGSVTTPAGPVTVGGHGPISPATKQKTATRRATQGSKHVPL
jgi:hypothetical protein